MSSEDYSFYVFPVYDPNFRVDSPDNYEVLINYLANLTMELSEEYSDKPVLVVYVLEQQ